MQVSSFALAIAFLAAPLSGCTLHHPNPLDPTIHSGGLVAVSPGVPRRLRVVSFNVKYRSSAKLIAAFERDPVLRDADIVLLQEMESFPDDDRPARLARARKMTYVYAPAYQRSRGGTHGLAVLSRFPLVDAEVIELPRYDVHINESRPIALAVSARIGGRLVRVYNVHLTNRINPSQRLRQLQPVIERAARHPVLEVIVGGDFNTSWFRWGAHLLPVPGANQPRMLDRFMRARGFGAPMAERRATHAWLDMRLDSIYTRNLQVRGKGVRDRVTISDHFPIWTDIAWPPAEAALAAELTRVGQTRASAKKRAYRKPSQSRNTATATGSQSVSNRLVMVPAP